MFRRKRTAGGVNYTYRAWGEVKVRGSDGFQLGFCGHHCMFFVKDGQRIEFGIERDAVGNRSAAGWPGQERGAPPPSANSFIAQGLRQAREAFGLFGYHLDFGHWLDEQAENEVR